MAEFHYWTPNVRHVSVNKLLPWVPELDEGVNIAVIDVLQAGDDQGIATGSPVFHSPDSLTHVLVLEQTLFKG